MSQHKTAFAPKTQHALFHQFLNKFASQQISKENVLEIAKYGLYLVKV